MEPFPASSLGACEQCGQPYDCSPSCTFYRDVNSVSKGLPAPRDRHDGPIPSEDIELVWQEWWVPIVAPDGKLDIAQLKKELYDYSVMMGQVSEVYDAATGGLISKPNTMAWAVIAAIDDFYAETQ